MRFMTMLICNHGEVGLGFSSEDHEFQLCPTIPLHHPLADDFYQHTSEEEGLAGHDSYWQISCKVSCLSYFSLSPPILLFSMPCLT